MAEPAGTQRPARVAPLSPEFYAVQFTMSKQMHDDLRYAQDLLGHQLGAGDVATVFGRALVALIAGLEKRKFAATARPRLRQGRPAAGARYIPAHARRAVWQRDQGRCTFVSESGRRCEASTRLEFDHVTEVARGGEATVGGIRLRCRAHNQYQAEQTFGADFMRRKREAAQGEAKARATRDVREGDDMDVTPWLRELGYRADQARWAAERCADMPAEATLEEQVRAALRLFCRNRARAV